MCVCVCVWSGGYNLQDVVFYWTRGNDSVKGLDTLRLAQYSVESYYTTVSEAVYETGRILQLPEFPLQVKIVLSLCLFFFKESVPSQDNTPSWCCILHCAETCCSSSLRHMFPPFCWWFSPGSLSGSASPLSQLGPVLVSTRSLTAFHYRLNV